MKAKLLGLAIVGSVAVAAAVWALAEPPAMDSSAPAARASERAGDDSQRTALRATPQARTYGERKAFERETRGFLRDAANLGDVARSERARTLSGSIDAYERAGQMSAGEALMLRVALIRAASADDAEAAERIAETTGRYRAAGERREAAFAAQQRNDPRFQSYKARERAVVAEVAAMREIPAGLSRDEYLRQRLEQERIRAYR